jgi:hypothetical protein
MGAMETIEAIEGLGLDYHEGNVLKYLSRWRMKGGLQDLYKAQWYLNRYIMLQERMVYTNTKKNTE